MKKLPRHVLTDDLSSLSVSIKKKQPERKAFAAEVKKAQDQGVDVRADPMFIEMTERYQTEFFERSARFAESTLKKLRSGWSAFEQWCIDNEQVSFPAISDTVEMFLEAKSLSLHRNTLSGYLWAISQYHLNSGCPDPTATHLVKDRMAAIRSIKIQEREGIKQAVPFRESHLNQLFQRVEKIDTFQVIRNVLLLSVAYETLLRESELARIRVCDVRFQDDGSAVIDVYFTKTNKTGNIEVVYISPQVAALMHKYLRFLDIDDKEHRPLFSQSTRHGTPYKLKLKSKESKVTESINRPLSMMQISAIFTWASDVLYPNEHYRRKFTAHSARVGAAQDLLSNGFSPLQVMQAGRWKSEIMVMRYGHDILASRSAMAVMRQGSIKSEIEVLSQTRC